MGRGTTSGPPARATQSYFRTVVVFGSLVPACRDMVGKWCIVSYQHPEVPGFAQPLHSRAATSDSHLGDDCLHLNHSILIKPSQL